MIFQELNPWFIGLGVTIGIVIFLFVIFLAARYRKFKTNQFVIHLRNGKVKHAGLGGSLFLLPLIDEYIVIPTTSIQTLVEAHEQVVSNEYQNIEIEGLLIWKVIDPEKAFSAVSWNMRDDNYVEKIFLISFYSPSFFHRIRIMHIMGEFYNRVLSITMTLNKQIMPNLKPLLIGGYISIQQLSD